MYASVVHETDNPLIRKNAIEWDLGKFLSDCICFSAIIKDM